MDNVYFFDEEGKIKTYRLPPKQYAYGSLGTIYKLNNHECLKWFTEEYPYDIEAIKKIKELKLDNYYEIYDLLFDKDNEFAGYTMKYYQPEDINILEMPTEYTLDNLYKLYNSITKLSNCGIFVDDFHSGNAILNKDGITLIDSDLYSYGHGNKINKKMLLRKNTRLLLYLFAMIYYDAVGECKYREDFDDIIIDELFNMDESVKNVEKKLVKYKYPIDYINKMRKEIDG